MVGDVDGKYLTRRHSQMKSARTALDNHCEEIARLVLPMMAEFQSSGGPDRQKGDKRTQRLMESTAPLALSRYASAVEGFLVPRGERWSKITTNDKRLNQSARVKLYFDDVNDVLFGARYDPRTGFQTQIHACLTGQGAFGTAGMFTDGVIRMSQNRGAGLAAGMIYSAIPLVNLYVSQGANGVVDTVHREWRHSARNCIADFGEDCPAEIAKAVKTDPDKEFQIVHAVMPNPDFRPGALGPMGMRFASFYFWPEKSQIISRGGFRTLRYAIARGPAGPGEHYGRSPAMLILAEIKTVNEMRRSILRAQHLTLNPPALLHSEMGANLRQRPGDLNFGMVSADGKPLAIPYQMGNQFPPAEREMERIRTIINDAFLLTLFQILVERPQQTATETLQRAKEQAIIVSPLIGKLQSEFLGSVIESELDTLSDFGALPEMPPELIEAQGEYQITYQSDIMRALQQGELDAYQAWLRDVSPMASVNPFILETVDHQGIARDAAEKRGIPQRFIRTDAQLDKLRQRQDAARAASAGVDAASALTDIQQTRAQTDAVRAGR